MKNYITLLDVLSNERFSLSLAPGFFCFYAHIGALLALEEYNVLTPHIISNNKNRNINQNNSNNIGVRAVSGSSAGAIIGGMLCSGMSLNEMKRIVLDFRRESFWDPINSFKQLFSGGIGLLEGNMFLNILKDHLPINNFDECIIPFAVTAYNIKKFRTDIIKDGCLASAIRASSTFPGLFQPCKREEHVLIDGGVQDKYGIYGLKYLPKEKIILNIIFDEIESIIGPSQIPNELKYENGKKIDVTVISIVLINIPKVNPFKMEIGKNALYITYYGFKKALNQPLIHGNEKNHWLVIVDGNDIDLNVDEIHQEHENNLLKKQNIHILNNHNHQIKHRSEIHININNNNEEEEEEINKMKKKKRKKRRRLMDDIINNDNNYNNHINNENIKKQKL